MVLGVKSPITLKALKSVVSAFVFGPCNCSFAMGKSMMVTTIAFKS